MSSNHCGGLLQPATDQPDIRARCRDLPWRPSIRRVNIMSRLIRTLAASWFFAIAGFASASYHTWEIAELYSNADGSIQFIQLRETQGFAGENLLAGRTLTATHLGVVKTFVFPNDLPSP